MYNRKITLFKIHIYFLIFFRSLYFINPLKFLYFYILKKTPKNIIINKKYKIKFSQHAHDFITFVVIFFKKEYGTISENHTIIDIGGNIGLFAIYAHLNNINNKIISFEPSFDAFNILKRNIYKNNLNKKIFIYNGAVTEKKQKKIYFPKKSSPYNSLITSYKDQTVAVKNYNLNDFLIDDEDFFLKLDCEGTELKIIKSIKIRNLNKIKKIRMETHSEEIHAEVISYLLSFDFIIENEIDSIIWFKKK